MSEPGDERALIEDEDSFVPISGEMSEVEASSPPLSEEHWIVPSEAAGERLDAFLARVCPRYSRVQLRRAVTSGLAQVEGRPAKPAFRLVPGQKVTLKPPAESPTGSLPEPIPLQVIYEDEAIAVIDKPAGMVVHPARGHWSGTLTAALAYHFQHLSKVGGATRPGIVHRLDRDTTGLILVAKTDAAHLGLAAQFEAREIQKEYWALISPVPDRDRDQIVAPIGPHPQHREKMAVRLDHAEARAAETFYEIQERFRGIAAVKVLPKTGRTHQIRVHLAYRGYPILADRLYGGRAQVTAGDLSGDRENTQVLLDRQALHARRLKLVHPLRGEVMEFESPLPPDLQQTLDALRRWRGLTS